MDNGRHNVISSSPDVDDNLNIENWQRSLEISAPVDLPSPEQLSQSETKQSFIGGETKYQTEESPATADNPASTLGQIVPVDAPASAAQTPLAHPDANLIRTSGDHLDKASLNVISSALEKLNQTGNLNDFYDEARNMTEINLNNSFNRKLGNNNDAPGENN